MSGKRSWQKWTVSEMDAMDEKLQQLKDIELQGVIGQTVGNITLTELIGEGGMGKVYLAEHIQLKTPYAVKVLLPDLSTDPTVAERFRREAMMSSRLRHPHIVFITDFGYHDHLGLYLTMEYLEGITLKEHIKAYPEGMKIWDAISMMLQLCDALGFAHESGVIHRDLKPENIFLQKHPQKEIHMVKVLDFGIARLVEASGRKLTMEGHVLGTPYYTAPEQIMGKEITAQTDIYALGAVLYQMLSGQPPFKGSSGMEIFTKHLMHTPPPISTIRKDLAETKLNDLINLTLQKDPDLRPISMHAFQAQLIEALQELQSMGFTDAQEEISFARSGSYNQIPQIPSLPQKNVRLSGIFDQIDDFPSTSMLAFFYQAQHELSSLSIPLFFTATWSALLWDLAENETSSPEFQYATHTLVSLFELLLQEADEPNPDAAALPVLQRAIRDLFALTSTEQQKVALAVLQPVMSHHLFPEEFLPKWATAQTTGTWKRLRNVLNQDIRVLFGIHSQNSQSELSSASQAELPAAQPKKVPKWSAGPEETTRQAESPITDPLDTKPT